MNTPTGSTRIIARSIHAVRPSPENEELYRPVDPNDPEVVELAESIRRHGVQEPVVITRDNWILSGHRRHAAAKLAGLAEIPCRIHPIRRDKDPDEFVKLLREFNRQRNKSYDEKLREEVVSADPEQAYQALISHRESRADVSLQTIDIRGTKRRATITDAKAPFLAAIRDVIAGRRPFWPLSDRQIHYALLNDPPLIHAKKPTSRYNNTHASYKALVELLTRARVAGLIPFEAIADETRPMLLWNIHSDVQTFLRSEVNDLFTGYWRDLMQSQPNHIEVIAEKLTVASVVKPVTSRYTIPTTIGRGFCSLPPRYQIAQRFRRSGKSRLILLMLSDFDPDGEEIAHSLAQSLRDDFGIFEVEPIKVALTADQVQTLDLPPMLKAKQTSSRYGRFAEQHGDDVYELEAIKPEALQRLLIDAIDAVLDVEAFNHEVDHEKQDAAFLGTKRLEVHRALKIGSCPNSAEVTAG